jgi:hypothetical protein
MFLELHSTGYLRFIAENGCHLVLDRSNPRKEHIWLKTSDGRYMERRSPTGFAAPVELLPAVLDDYRAASLVAQDGPEDENGCTVFRLTQDGMKRGLGEVDLSQQANVLYWPDAEQPTRGYARCRGNRSFGTVRAALKFVLHDLTENERATALVTSLPQSFDFTDPETAIRTQEMLKESR